jgi:hypothetical protein
MFMIDVVKIALDKKTCHEIEKRGSNPSPDLSCTSKTDYESILKIQFGVFWNACC